jgi:hypothetical protein
MATQQYAATILCGKRFSLEGRNAGLSGTPSNASPEFEAAFCSVMMICARENT